MKHKTKVRVLGYGSMVFWIVFIVSGIVFGPAAIAVLLAAGLLGFSVYAIERVASGQWKW